ncbi:membrane protein [Candidatus Magnetoovum chiemensis]|nr:membrane protein [Candidatus Magnetoovum chiemensis]
MTLNVINDVFNNSVARKALFALHILFNFAAMWFIFRNDLAMQYIYPYAQYETMPDTDPNLKPYVELGVVGALSFWSLCWHSKTLKKRFGSDDTILLSSFILFFTAAVAVKAMECYTIDPVVIVGLPYFGLNLSDLPYQFLWQIVLIFLNEKYEKADHDNVKRHVILSSRIIIFLYFCYLGNYMIMFTIGDLIEKIQVISNDLLRVSIYVFLVLWFLAGVYYLVGNYELLWIKSDCDNIKTKTFVSLSIVLLLFLSYLDSLGLLFIISVLTEYSNVTLGIAVVLLILSGAFGIVYYLIATFKGLCVNSLVAARFFVIAVIVIGLTTLVFSHLLLVLPILLQMVTMVGFPAYLLFFVIVFFLLVKCVTSRCYF